jgi:YbbR domain-containing protein
MSLRHLIQHNFWLKLFSFILAALIWFFIQFGIERRWESPAIFNDLQKQHFRNVPVAVLTKAGDLRRYRIIPTAVSITLVGESAVLANLNTRTFKAYVDATDPVDAEGGGVIVRTDAPAGVTVLDISPRSVAIEQLPP